MASVTLPAEKRVERAHAQLMRHKDFCLFSGVFMVGKVSVDETTPTAKTNGRDVTYGRAFVDSLNDKELVGLILHESGHVMWQHGYMWKGLWKKNARLANQAADYVINLDIDKMAKRFPLVSSPVYMEFLQGERDLPCTAWGMPTYNVKGWKGPCYLITDGHYKTFEELMTRTQWENYGTGNDPRCEDCMVHCGYEPSAAYGVNAKMMDPFKSLSWLLR